MPRFHCEVRCLLHMDQETFTDKNSGNSFNYNLFTFSSGASSSLIFHPCFLHRLVVFIDALLNSLGNEVSFHVYEVHNSCKPKYNIAGPNKRSTSPNLFNLNWFCDALIRALYCGAQAG